MKLKIQLIALTVFLFTGLSLQSCKSPHQSTYAKHAKKKKGGCPCYD